MFKYIKMSESAIDLRNKNTDLQAQLSAARNEHLKKTQMSVLTQDEYDALSSKVAGTFYFIKDSGNT